MLYFSNVGHTQQLFIYLFSIGSIMMPSRLYTHVSFNQKSSTWVVQRDQKFICSHTDQHEAAKMAAKAFGVSRKSLLLENANHGPAKHRRSVYKYVCFHARRRVWYAQTRQQWHGTFNTEIEAAQAIVNANLAQSVHELKRNKFCTTGIRMAVPPRKVIAKAKANAKAEDKAKAKAKAKKTTKAKAKAKSKVKAPLSKERFRDLWKVYRDYEGGSAKACVPGDLEDAARGTRGLPRRLTAIHILLKCPRLLLLPLRSSVLPLPLPRLARASVLLVFATTTTTTTTIKTTTTTTTTTSTIITPTTSTTTHSSLPLSLFRIPWPGHLCVRHRIAKHIWLTK
jgi:hypothetical protein